MVKTNNTMTHENYSKADLENMYLADVKRIARELGIRGYSAMKKYEIVDAILSSDEPASDASDFYDLEHMYICDVKTILEDCDIEYDRKLTKESLINMIRRYAQGTDSQLQCFLKSYNKIKRRMAASPAYIEAKANRGKHSPRRSTSRSPKPARKASPNKKRAGRPPKSSPKSSPRASPNKRGRGRPAKASPKASPGKRGRGRPRKN